MIVAFLKKQSDLKIFDIDYKTQSHPLNSIVFTIVSNFGSFEDLLGGYQNAQVFVAKALETHIKKNAKNN